MGYKFHKSKKLFKYIAKTKVDAMLEKVRDNKRDYLIMLVLWHTGIHNSELRNLKQKDIKKDEITIRQGKGNKDRIIPIDTTLYDLLNFYASNLSLEDSFYPKICCFYLLLFYSLSKSICSMKR